MEVEAVQRKGRRARAPFRTLSVHESRALLLYGIERRQPIQVVVGRAGSGKSTLLSAIARTAIVGAEFVLLDPVPATVAEIIELLAGRFGVSGLPGEAPFEHLGRLADALAARRRAGRLVALLVDDAHVLPPSSLLDLRLLAGTAAEGGALLPIVLAGRPELAERLSEPSLEPLRRATGTHIELRRPFPAQAPEEQSALPPASRRVPRRVAIATVAGVAMLGAALLLERAGPGPVSPIAARPGATIPAKRPVSPPRALPAPRPRGVQPSVIATARPSPGHPKPTAQPPLEGGHATGGDPRAVAREFAQAIAARDLRALAALFAPSVRQNGLRGRTVVLETYAERFRRVDAPFVMDPPTRVTMDGERLAVEAPFRTGYRTADGAVGYATGTLRMGLLRRKDRLLIDSVDWAFATDVP